ncbi:hypothetical protein JXA02_01810 [candidate division KSB1 bacterium]|nr:hypothetical protein [candidate division KSB1 bacterium]RQW10719.1 MAG: hypothetical protein EH222_02005 [candidate division KSB1 bacterium]
MRATEILVAVMVLLSSAVRLESTVVNSGRGLPHAKAAYTTRAGHLTTIGNIGFWGKKSTFPNKTLNIETGATLWLVQAIGDLTYGFSSHGDVSFTPILYQDAHKADGDQIPWDTLLRVKFGNYKVERRPIWLGFEIGTRFPTGKKHNVLFEDYTAGHFEFGLTGLLTYRYTSPNLLNDFRVNANLGYWNYNDNGVQLTEVDPAELGRVSRTSQSFQYAAGIEFPTTLYEYGLELYGLAWIVTPPPGAAGRENYFYMNVSFVYKPHHRFSFITSADLRLSPASDTTVGFEPDLPGMPSYPGWRINFGVKYLILPKSVYDMHKTSIDQQKAIKTKKLYSQLEEEIDKTNKSKQELERLRKEREAKEANQLHTK